MKNLEKYKEFLNNVKKHDPVVVEAIQKATSLIFESTEDIVQDVKDKVGSDEKEEWKKLLKDTEENIEQQESDIEDIEDIEKN